jgi:hypothetical protein
MAFCGRRLIAEFRKLIECVFRALKHGIPLRKGLPAPDRDVDVAGINLKAPRTSSYLLGRHDGRAGTRKSVEDYAAATGAIAHRVDYEGYGFNRGMHRQFVHATRAKRIHAGIGPHIAPRAAMLSEFKGVEVRGLPPLVNEYQLVLAAIKAPLPWSGFRPNTNVLKFVVYGITGFGQFPHMAPIHAYVSYAAINGVVCT